MMSPCLAQPIGLLLLEDDPIDAQLVADVLSEAGLRVAIDRVDTRASYEAALHRGGFAAILSDFSLPSFDGRTALRLARDVCPEVPFILVSGAIGEEAAVECLRGGAVDYVLKQRLTRLPPVVIRALNEADEQRRRREAEEALRLSEERYRGLVETAFDWIWEVDGTARYTYASPRVFDLLGYRPEEVLGRTPFEFMPGAEADRMKRLFDDHAARCEAFVMLENTNRHRDGHVVVLETSGVPILSADGGLLGYRGMDRDVTARKQSDERLRTLARAVEQSPASIVITNLEGTIEFVNPKFTAVTGFSAAEVIGENPRILKSGETPQEEYRQLWHTIASGEVWRGEFHNRRKDGTLFWETASISPVRDATGGITHFVAVKEDVTEKRLTEAKLLRTQRLESIGSLASGIAHDLNNILTPIVMSATFLRDDDGPAAREEVIQTIESCADRAVGVVRQLLSFARGKEGRRQPLQVRHLIHEVARVTRETFPRAIATEEDCAHDLWPVVADSTQILQVLVNLCVNARDAMPSGGTLRLQAGNIVLDDHFACMDDKATPGPYVRIVVEDTGCGIPDDALDHIFEPFFTTKGADLGTGLGLATVKGIVSDHRGFVSFWTQAMEGTRFEVYLPAAPGSAPGLADLDAAEQAVRGHGELVLVVDDEPVVAESVRRTLLRQGYAVQLAGNGVEALHYVESQQARVGAVVTDLMMPGMDGVTLCRALRRLAPDLPIVVVCGALFGEAERVIREQLGELGITHVLQKPHRGVALMSALATCLRDGCAERRGRHG